MLKLYTDQNFINETYRKQLFPLLFDICILKNDALKDYYALETDIAKADVVVFPIHFNAFVKHKDAYITLKACAEQHYKPVWVYTSGDFGYTLKPDYITFRLSGYASRLSSNTVIIPSFINDPYIKLHKSFFTVHKTEQPTIGFVGHAQSGLKKWAKEWFIYLKTQARIIITHEKSDLNPFYPSGYKRAKYLKHLEHCQTLSTNFIYRTHYRAGVDSTTAKEQTSLEFYKNMSENGYTFCIRGAGNFSVRFYETLAMGRIPVLINTDCKLPLEDFIDWHKHAVILEEKDIFNIEDKLQAFHQSLTHEEFISLQQRNRNLWLNRLERVSFFKTIQQHYNTV